MYNINHTRKCYVELAVFFFVFISLRSEVLQILIFYGNLISYTVFKNDVVILFEQNVDAENNLRHQGFSIFFYVSNE